MIFFKLLFFLIGLFGVTIIWGLFGFVYLSMNHEKVEQGNKFLVILRKLVIIGPLYVGCIYYKIRNKKGARI